MAFVMLRPHASSKWKGKDGQFEVELKKFGRDKLPGFACPEWVQVVEELPVGLFF
jgi:acyl-coenzyme A synthetase/AMP-(fatty) acid ligase